MGAQQFYTTAKGNTAKEAFEAAHSDACYRYGHDGYSGTLAEKSSYKMISVPKGKKPSEFIDELLEKDDSRIRDKWGPAGCVLLKTEMIPKIEVIPQKPKTAKVKNITHEGARKWVTYHVLYADGKEIGRELKKNDALKKGKEYAISKQVKVTVKLEKHLEGSNPIEAEIEPNIPKAKERKVKEELNTYAFFGWASS